MLELPYVPRFVPAMECEFQRFIKKGVFSWTDLLPGETLADIVSLRAPCKLKGAGTDMNRHADSDGSTAKVSNVTTVSGIKTYRG